MQGLSSALEFLPRRWLMLPVPLISLASAPSLDDVQCARFVSSLLTVEIPFPLPFPSPVFPSGVPACGGCRVLG